MPGARLHYDVRGAGPLLLLISGGEGGAEGYENLAGRLAGDYTVVTYDRRGNLRSPLDDPSQEVSIATHSDDAHRLLAALTTGPAYVFGSSAGALIGLDVAMHHPARVRMLVAHEPPVEGVLPEFDRLQEEIQATYVREGGAAALTKLMRQLGVTYDSWEPGVLPAPRNPQDIGRRGEIMMAYTFRAVHGYKLDMNALAAAPVQVVLAGGSAARESLSYRAAATLAGRLGKPLLDFPGHHAGYVNWPGAFAEALARCSRPRDTPAYPPLRYLSNQAIVFAQASVAAWGL